MQDFFGFFGQAKPNEVAMKASCYKNKNKNNKMFNNIFFCYYLVALFLGTVLTLTDQCHAFLTTSITTKTMKKTTTTTTTTVAKRYLQTIEKTNDEWKELLTPEQYYVLREEGTEAPNTSDLNFVGKNKHEPGTFVCAGCNSPLFITAAKFDSGTGWPSFFTPIDNDAITLSTDFKLLLPRTECSCSVCGGHLGHVFDDGPEPTGQRFCMNGIAMKFIPDVIVSTRTTTTNEEGEGEEQYQNQITLDLMETVKSRGRTNPYRLSLSQVLPSILTNGIVGGLFFTQFLAKLEANGNGSISSLVDLFPLLPALYFGTKAAIACNRLSIAMVPQIPESSDSKQ